MNEGRIPLTDADIERFLRARSADPDPALWNDIVAATASIRQRGAPWSRWFPRRPVLAILVTTVLLAALAGAIGAGAGLFRPSPTSAPEAGETRWLNRPHFTFVIPAGSGLVLDDGVNVPVQFVAGDRGVDVFRLLEASLYPCDPGDPDGSGLTNIGGTPSEVIENLRTIGGVAIGPASRATLDGHPALTARVDPSAHLCDVHIHLDNQTLSSAVLEMDQPAWLIVADVDGEVVGVSIWAESSGDLDAWLPTAMEFVDSIRFGAPIRGEGSSP